MDNSESRFVDFSDRHFESTIHNFYSDFVGDYVAKVKHSKWNYQKWKGLVLMKDPMSLSVYQQMLQDLKPATILEFGCFEGGSALWMHDILKAVGHDTVIHTFDINQEQVKLPATEGIEFHQVDNLNIEQFYTDNKQWLDNLKHPILAIEDSHVNAAGVMVVIDRLLQAGDYLIVEDTLSEAKHETMETFIQQHDYLVDTHYCDFWGYNNSWNVNSIFKKTGA